VQPRIKPLARGTLALPRAAPPPARVSTSQHAPSASSPRTSSPLPPPLPRSPAPPAVVAGRVVLPPPVPGYAPAHPGAAGGSVSATMPPMTASIALEPAANRSQTLGLVALAAVAAGAVVFATMREYRGSGTAAAPPPSSQAASLSPSPATAPPGAAPATSWTVIETPTRLPPAVPKARVAPVVHAPRAQPPASAAASASATPVPVMSASQEPPRQPALAKPAVAEAVPTVGEFGGRE
jgi:hypothetical protein